MSIPVELAEVPAQVSRLGPGALLVTNSAEGPPHVASVLVASDGELLTMGAGRKTRANIATNPAMTLVWPAVDGEHCLIVDGTAEEDRHDSVLMRPTSAILHRLTRAEGANGS